MQVLVNGDSHPVDKSSTLFDLISKLQLTGKFAIEINEMIIPRSEYVNTELQADDKIEIVEAIGGG